MDSMHKPQGRRLNGLNRCLCLFACLVANQIPGYAQNIHVGLYPTASIDSFEVRMHSLSGYHTGIVNATFTLRWESAAGGVVNNGDLGHGCDELQVINVGGVFTDGDFNYATFNVLSLHPLTAACAITSTPAAVVGIKIRELTGCRRVSIANDSHTSLYNGNYFISIAGYDRTGNILTAPLESGICAPCEPPQISSATALAYGPFCIAGPVSLSAVISAGLGLDLSWYGPSGGLIGSSISTLLPSGQYGTYTLVVSNDCGSDSILTATQTDTTCIAPEISELTIGTLSCVEGTLQLGAQVDDGGACPSYSWSGPAWSSGTLSQPPIAHTNALPGTYTLFVVTACGIDSLSVDVTIDTTDCAPPILHGITTFGGNCSPLILSADVSGSSHCLAYEWTGPTEVDDGSSFAEVVNPIGGLYSVTVSNACGTTTGLLSFLPDTVGCVPPVLDSLSYTGMGCPGNPLRLVAHFSEPITCPYFTWSGPTYVSDGPSTVVIQAGMAGEYEVIASNGCGSDTLSVVVLEAAEVYLAPFVGSVSSNSPVCEGDTLMLSADVNDTNTDLSFTWNIAVQGTGQVIQMPGVSPTLALSSEFSGVYTLTLSNTCGSSTNGTLVTVISSSAQAPCILCESAGPIDLGTFLSGSIEGGIWTYDQSTHSSVYDPEVDAPGLYIYADPSPAQCPLVEVNIIELAPQSSGQGGDVTICADADPVPLFPYLSGNPGIWGTWTYGLDNNMPGGIYDPSIFSPGNYRYHAFCSTDAPAIVEVSEVEPQWWFSDADGDGLGDPIDSVLGCAPAGYVLDQTDLCLDQFGTVGSSCDDGLPFTENDTIDPTCNCVGQIPDGVTEMIEASERPMVWPNPGSGPWSMVLPSSMTKTGKLMLEFFDAQGQLVNRISVTSPGNRIVDFGTGSLSSGVYTLRASSARRSVQLLLVVY